MKRALVFVALLAVVASNANAQSPTLQQKLYYTCKVWGFVKYYHSNVSTCNVNWDSVLISVLPAISTASTDSEFNDVLDTMLAAAGPMALSATYFPDTISSYRKRNRDWSWIASPIFRSDVQTILDTIKNNFRPHTSCWYKTNPNEGSVSLFAAWGGYLEFPHDTVLLPVTTYITYPDQNHRLLELFKYWNVVRYFNPYNYVLDVPWDSTLYNYVLPIANVSDAESLSLLYIKMATALDDAHAYLLTWNENYQILPGFFKPKIQLKHIGGQYVIIKSLESGINIGDAIVSIDGLTPTQWEDSLRPYYSSGNQAVFRRTISVNMLGRLSSGISEVLVISDSLGTNHTYTVSTINPNTMPSFWGYYYPADSLKSVLWTTLSCDIGYVNMAKIQSSDAAAMYSQLKDKRAIIFDHRNDAFAEGFIAPLMFNGSRQFATLSFPDTTYPGVYYYVAQYMTGLSSTPYTGKIILLFDEFTQSHIEYSAMFLGALDNVIKVGSQTAGADGDITWLSASNDMHVGWSSLGVYYPNGDSTQRIGIIPDTVVYPTRAGIRHGDDEVLDKALQVACVTSVHEITERKSACKIYPNPANDVVHVEVAGISESNVELKVTDVTGRTVLEITADVNNGTVSDVISLRKLVCGMYFVTVKAGLQRYVAKVVKD